MQFNWPIIVALVLGFLVLYALETVWRGDAPPDGDPSVSSGRP
ncbi:MAG TPA: hypothetical protein VN397_03110 [Candidatus Methylomirabilis sp.]|nr:hypothetical protein [Candidatus Methylomirabilis sp.]